MTLRSSVVAGVLVATAVVAGCGGDGTASSTTSSTVEAAPTTEGATTTEAVTTTAPPVELPADRPIEVLVPASATGEEPRPLVVLLHGYSVDGATQTAYLGMAEAADRAGMLLVAPDGTEDGRGLRFWNATAACCAFGSDVDDSAYLADVIAKVGQDHPVDPDRTFVVGHSNGGFMAFRMACEHADLVAAVVSIEGSTYDDPADCRPSQAVSTLQVHGTADATITYEGGTNGRAPYPGARDTLAQWAELDGCDPEPDAPAPADRAIVTGLAPATVTRHSGCTDGVEVELWTQPDGVHIPAFTADFSDQLLAWLDDHAR